MKQITLTFLLTEGEVELLKKITYLEPTLEDNLARIKKEDGKFRIKFDSDDLLEILGAVEFSAQLESCREQSEHSLLHRRLKAYLNLAHRQG